MKRKVVVEIDLAPDGGCGACPYLILTGGDSGLCALILQAVRGRLRLEECKRRELPVQGFFTSGEVQP